MRCQKLEKSLVFGNTLLSVASKPGIFTHHVLHFILKVACEIVGGMELKLWSSMLCGIWCYLRDWCTPLTNVMGVLLYGHLLQ